MTSIGLHLYDPLETEAHMMTKTINIAMLVVYDVKNYLTGQRFGPELTLFNFIFSTQVRIFVN